MCCRCSFWPHVLNKVELIILTSSFWNFPSSARSGFRMWNVMWGFHALFGLWLQSALMEFILATCYKLFFSGDHAFINQSFPLIKTKQKHAKHGGRPRVVHVFDQQLISCLPALSVWFLYCMVIYSLVSIPKWIGVILTCFSGFRYRCPSGVLGHDHHHVSAVWE